MAGDVGDYVDQARMDTAPKIIEVDALGLDAEPTGGPAPAAAADLPDIAYLQYSSGSTRTPTGVMLSHRNLVVGAHSVVAYLHNGPDDVLLAALPLSFDAGFSQLTTAFTAGAHLPMRVPSGAMRQYSLCSDPGETGFYQLAVKREAGGRGGSGASSPSLEDSTGTSCMCGAAGSSDPPAAGTLVSGEASPPSGAAATGKAMPWPFSRA